MCMPCKVRQVPDIGRWLPGGSDRRFMRLIRRSRRVVIVLDTPEDLQHTVDNISRALLLIEGGNEPPRRTARNYDGALTMQACGAQASLEKGRHKAAWTSGTN
jgi:hypothetical protein